MVKMIILGQILAQFWDQNWPFLAGFGSDLKMINFGAKIGQGSGINQAKILADFDLVLVPKPKVLGPKWSFFGQVLRTARILVKWVEVFDQVLIWLTQDLIKILTDFGQNLQILVNLEFLAKI